MPIRLRKKKESSQKLVGLPNTRYYAAHRLVAWQPRGVLNDFVLDQVVEWTLSTEKLATVSFNRLVDLTQLTMIKLDTSHLLTIARERSLEYAGPGPVKAAFYCENLVGFGIALMYEKVMEGSLIETRAFRERIAVAEWLGVPLEIAELKDEPMENA